MDTTFPITKLNRAHQQWKALKLAGALAVIQNTSSINIEQYKCAIQFTELLSNDIKVFEEELTKESYEAFVSYVKQYSVNGTYDISLHNLRKAGFIALKGQSSTAMNELVKLCNSYDSEGDYTVENDIVHYRELIKSDTIGVSYVEVNPNLSKRDKAIQATKGYIYEELQFSDLINMLKCDLAYCPFKFKNGIRGKENLEGTTKWIVLDVDDSEITYEEAHTLITDINHIIVKTSNNDNPNKYRVLIELDVAIDIPDTNWIKFTKAIATDLGFNSDALAKAQIYFSYSNRDMLYTLDATPLEVKPYISIAREVKEVKKPSKAVCNTMLEDMNTTFEPAFQATDGNGRRKIIWAIKYARELGCNRSYAHELVDSIMDYWIHPLPEKDIKAIHSQIDRWNFNID